MATTKSLTVYLKIPDFERLQRVAMLRGISSSELVREYVRAGLGEPEAESEGRPRGRRALDRLAELTANLPAVDALALARESRAELEQR